MVRVSITSLLSVLLLLSHSMANGAFTSSVVGGRAALRKRQYGAMGHGAYGMFDGVEYRWHQIYDGTWAGVDPNDWDDNIHTQNDAPPPWHGHTTQSATNISSLSERALVDKICSAGNAFLKP